MAAKSPFAEAVSLTGKVTDQGGRPLAGVAVSLVAAPQISDTTGGDGTFTLMGITSALRFHATKHVGNGPAQVTLGRHDGFVFLKGTEADSPEGYDARGARMPTVPAAREERGAPPLGNADVTQENSGKVLSKIASLDFVEASKPGYAVRRVPIESYSGIVNISLTASPDFGPNVFVFDPGMPMARIQSRVDSIFKQNERGEFTSQHYAYLFKPGQYSLDVNIPFYAEALGLGTTPDSVAITGQVRSSAAWRNGNATTTFWRSCANLAVTPSSGYARWVVSQGAPFRRMHIKGHLLLSDNGWSSGGFIADSKIDGTVYSGSQQQWLSRNSSWGGWNGGSWNMMFVGIDKPPAGTWPTPPYTVIAKTPLIREKPYLVIDAAGNYSVMVPPLLKDSSLGAGWLNGTAGNPGTGKADTAQIPIDRFYIAHADVDNAASLNAALSQGKHLLLTPGVYHLESSLQVTLAGTVILGLGLPCLAPDNGTPAITTADVDGLKIAGLILEAGAANSPTLLQMGPDAVGPGNMGATGADHAADPSTVQDVFCRAGGSFNGLASSLVTINSNNVIADHLWLWRADHGAGAAWDSNANDNGLTVNGNDATVYGLFVEHCQKYQTVWNGEGGRAYFYQSEMPYDPPDQASWGHDGVNGYASYKVGANVKTHEAWGLGVYCAFFNPNIYAENAFETPGGTGIRMHQMLTVSTGGNQGGINHVINGTGAAVNASNPQARVK